MDVTSNVSFGIKSSWWCPKSQTVDIVWLNLFFEKKCVTSVIAKWKFNSAGGKEKWQ